MAKILISSLGVGGKFKNPNTPDREYRKTCYKIQDTSYPESTFMASVLYEHFNLDGIIFIGTVKSMWEEVYRFVCEKKSVTQNDDYWYNLASKIDGLTYESELNTIELSPLEDILGKHSKCILTKADYTGGTKTLAAALVMAAVDCGISLYITIAARDNLVKVERGQVTQKVDTSFRT